MTVGGMDEPVWWQPAAEGPALRRVEQACGPTLKRYSCAHGPVKNRKLGKTAGPLPAADTFSPCDGLRPPAIPPPAPPALSSYRHP